MLIEDDLLSAGYKSYRVPAFRSAQLFFQKACRAKSGHIRYFINVYIYRHELYTGITFEVQLRSSHGFHFNIETIGCASIEQAEVLAETIYTAVGSLDYEEVQDVGM